MSTTGNGRGGNTSPLPGFLQKVTGLPLPRKGRPMDNDLVAILLGAILPVYPALFVIYQKIGRYDVMCEDLRALREEHERMVQGERHGPPVSPSECSQGNRT